jgi:hypothetical protein
MQFSGVTMTGGFGVVTGAAPVVPTDPYWANVSFLSETTSTNGQTNNTFLDDSLNALSISRFGTTTQGSYTPFTVANGSSYSTSTNGGSSSFLVSGDYLKSAASAGLSFNGDFTIECWVKTTTISLDPYGRRIWSFGSTVSAAEIDLGFYNGTAVTTNACVSVGNVGAVIVGTIAVADGNWHHVAVTRSGSSIKLFVDGVQSGSTYTSSATFSAGATNGMYISSLGGVGGYLVGNISSLRVVKGTAVYTANFTPPTTPLTAISGTSLLLNFTNAGMYDAAAKNNMLSTGTAQASTTQYKWAPTSTYFNGTTDYLTAPASQIFNLGTGDFTIEGWCNVSSFAGYPMIASLAVGTASTRSWYLLIYPDGLPRFTWSTDGTNLIPMISNTAATVNTWNHIAVTRSAGTSFLFLNGQQVATASTQSGAMYYNASAVFTLGREAGWNGSYLPGYIQDLRLTKGVARYTSNFSVPTAAFPTSA